jgi:DNA-binding NtrC family response regulator
VIPRIIHQNSARKHGHYIAVNCGAIPEGTIDSELFGHEKGAYTGAHEMRKGYFEVADGGTLFLDEVAELPLFTQVRLLRVLESGEFLKVGSSKVQKTNVRVIAATNADIPGAIHKGQFREDLYYRLNTVPVFMPPLRQRKEDIYLLFKKFASDFAESYQMPPIKLTPQAQEVLTQYEWPGNIRQLKNVVEQISVIESERLIDTQQIASYLPKSNPLHLPVPYSENLSGDYLSERDILYKVLWQLRAEMDQLKEQLRQMSAPKVQSALGRELVDTITETVVIDEEEPCPAEVKSLEEIEIETINKALEKNKGKRRESALELGISERTLYRKIKEYQIDN